MIFAVNGFAIPNFVLEADSKETCSKPHAVQQNVYVYYVVGVFADRETCWCYVSKFIGSVCKTKSYTNVF
jgi:hypothetical protein